MNLKSEKFIISILNIVIMVQMVEAFIFITTEIGKLNEVYDNIKRLDFVKKINTITGPYDITL